MTKQNCRWKVSLQTGALSQKWVISLVVQQVLRLLLSQHLQLSQLTKQGQQQLVHYQKPIHTSKCMRICTIFLCKWRTWVQVTNGQDLCSPKKERTLLSRMRISSNMTCATIQHGSRVGKSLPSFMMRYSELQATFCDHEIAQPQFSSFLWLPTEKIALCSALTGSCPWLPHYHVLY